MFPSFKEKIRIGSLELNFLLDEGDTDDTVVQFEIIATLDAKVPGQYFHVEVDQTL